MTSPQQPQSPPAPPGEQPFHLGQTAPPRKTRTTMPLLGALGLAGLALVVGCIGGIAIGTGVDDKPAAKSTPGAAAAQTSAAPATSAATPTTAAAPTSAVPPPPPPPPAAPTISDGTWTVGEDFPAGTYRVNNAPGDCYWSIYKSGTNQSDIIDNHLGAGNLRVTLKAGQDFETQRCGTWTKVG